MDKTKGRLSVLVPARGEIFLQQTINDVLSKAAGDVEVVVTLDGNWRASLEENERVKLVRFNEVRGMKEAVNAAYENSTGEFLMKIDAHVAFSEGYDEVLKADCADNWIVVPRRYSLDPDTWSPRNKEPIDSEYLFYPWLHPDYLGWGDRWWRERGRERREILLDEDMTFQGSCWFMTAQHFERLGRERTRGYGYFMGEPQHLGFQTQLGPWDGKIMRNKKCWYAHLHKGKQFGRMYHMEDKRPGNAHSFWYWWTNSWSERAHDLDWLIERFWPVPDWPEDWQTQSGYKGKKAWSKDWYRLLSHPEMSRTSTQP